MLPFDFQPRKRGALGALEGGYAPSPDIIDRASLLPIGQYEDGSLTWAVPGMVKDTWDSFNRGLERQGAVSRGEISAEDAAAAGAPRRTGPGIFDFELGDNLTYASAGPISGIAGRAAGLADDVARPALAAPRQSQLANLPPRASGLAGAIQAELARAAELRRLSNSVPRSQRGWALSQAEAAEAYAQKLRSELERPSVPRREPVAEVLEAPSTAQNVFDSGLRNDEQYGFQLHAPETSSRRALGLTRFEDPFYNFAYEITDAGRPTNQVVKGWINKDAATIDWIGGADGMASAKNDFGVAGLRQLREQFRSDFPEVRSFGGYRSSGARHGPASRNANPYMSTNFANDSNASLPALLASAVEQPKGIRAYHGSGRDLSGGRFDPTLAHPSAGLGPHFGNSEQASNFARARSEVNGTSGRVYPVELDIKNPVDLPDLFTWYPHQIARQIERQYPEHHGVLDAVDAADTALKELHPWQWLETNDGAMTLLNAKREALRSAMLDRGIDGIRYENKMAGEGAGTSYMAIKPGTVRSATTGETLFANDTQAGLPSLYGSDQEDNDVMSILQRYGLLGR